MVHGCDLCVYVMSDSIEKLPKLVEDIVQTSVDTGPRGVLRLAQGVQAFLGVGQEWLTDVSKVNRHAICLLSRHKFTFYFCILACLKFSICIPTLSMREYSFTVK